MASYNACVELLDRNIKAGRGAKTAYIDPNASLTYGALQARSMRFANLLSHLGVAREQRIGLALLDSVDYPAAFFGALRAGVVPVCLNTLLSTEQYAYMLNDSRAVALFVSASLLPTLKPAIAGAPALKHVIVTDCEGEPDGGFKNFSAALSGMSTEFSAVETSADETAFWLYSSGSTGSPKGTRHVHMSLAETARLYGNGVLGIRQDDIVHSAAKIFFAYGLGNSISFPMSVGATAILNPGRPTPTSVFEILGKYNPTIYCGVPTLYAAMLHDTQFAGHPGSSRLRISTSAGEGLPAHIGQAWRKRFGTDILDGVGSTEMLHIFLSNTPDDILYGASGRAVPGYELLLKDENGEPIEGEGMGELYVNGPTAADGYWNQREKTRNTFQGHWTRTGDKYTRDETGRYTYCGRADDMFKVSGIWVSPFEVEAALASHEAVLEAAVVPAADDDKLLKPKAFIVLKPGYTVESLGDSLKNHVKETVGLWKYPRWLVVTESLPKTATGKIQRFKLRDDL